MRTKILKINNALPKQNLVEKRMDLDEKIALMKKLVAQREEIDRELTDLFGGGLPTKRTRRCKACGGEGHDTRSCPQPATDKAASDLN